MPGTIDPIRTPITPHADRPADQRRWPAGARSRASASRSRGDPSAGPGAVGEQARPEVASRAQRERRPRSARPASSGYEQQHPAARLGPGAELRATSRTATASVSHPAPTCRRSRAGGRARRWRRRRWRRTCGRCRQLGGDERRSRRRPGRCRSTRPRTSSDPATGSPPAMLPAAASDARTTEASAAPTRTRAASGASRPTAVRADQLGAPGLLLDAGVPAYQDHGHERRRTRRRARSSWSSPARRGCGRRGSARRARRSRGWR